MATTITRFKNNFAAEWLRLWSVRSSWFFAACNIVGVFGIAFLAANSLASSAPAGGSPWQVAGFMGLPALFGCLVLFTIAATADHATGNIIPTLQWTPQRRQVLIVRTLLIVLSATIFGLLLVVAAATIIWLHAQQLVFFSFNGAKALGVVAFVYSCSILLTVGLSLLTRNTAAALSSIFGLILVLPIILQVFPFDWATTLIGLLPGSGVLYFLIGEGPGDTAMSNTKASLTLILWSLMLFIAGGWRFLRDDANN